MDYRHKDLQGKLNDVAEALHIVHTMAHMIVLDHMMAHMMVLNEPDGVFVTPWPVTYQVGRISRNTLKVNAGD